MSAPLTDAEIAEAMAACADEPVHIPGIVQPFGCLIAADAKTNQITYASENVADFLGHTAADLLGRSAPEVLGRDAWHGVRGALSRNGIDKKTISVNEFDFDGQLCALRVHRSDGQTVIEIEKAMDVGLSGANALNTLSYLMSQIQICDGEQALFDLTCELMQHLTGYDRVLIYRFDEAANGEVLAEVKRSPQEPFIGLRFPHWDIPAQARAIMAKIPLRFIQDTDQTPVPVLAPAGSPPLDMTLAEVRGVSSVHLEYLRNMGSAATMTLSIVVEGALWGMISFHHSRPKVPAPGLRDVLVSFVDVFNGKLLALRQQASLRQIAALDSGFIGQGEGEQTLETIIPSATPIVLDVLKAQGLAAISGDNHVTAGQVPDAAVLDAVAEIALSTGEVVVIDALAERFPEHADKLGGSAGVLAVAVLPDRVVCIFRDEIEEQVSWAGDPAKTVEQVDGRLRLSPRGSFSTFLQSASGQCEAWSGNDKYLIRHLRTLLHAAERQAMMVTLTRQQALMIGELNHRVRNILALVRSVSRQARRRYGSLNSYANAIENRIRALAAAHDITGGRLTAPISLHQLVRQEFAPFSSVADEQTALTGPDPYMRAETAPIFSLVLHELTTNAAKYGALSGPGGHVTVTLAQGENGSVTVDWRETGGPLVTTPNEHGFGMAMIQQAVPHELGGEAETTFEGGGFHAQFTLPARHFTTDVPDEQAFEGRRKMPETPAELPASLRDGVVMVLEDTFITAKEMADQLRDLGCKDVRVCAGVDAALDLIGQERLSFAVLDVDLSTFGPQETSESVAMALLAQAVPFVFVTGYGQDTDLPAVLDATLKLTKPISNDEFLQAVYDLDLD